MKNFYALFIFFFLFSKAASACDESSISIQSLTGNPDGTYTLVLNACIEMQGIEGIPEDISFEFSPSSVQVQSALPTSFSTFYGDNYVANIMGNILEYNIDFIFPSHNTSVLCDTFTIILSELPNQLVFDSHIGFSAPECVHTVDFCTPTNVQVAETTTSSATITWDAPSAPATKYHVRYRKRGDASYPWSRYIFYK